MASDVPLGPDFIRFLLSTKPKFDCYFVVGNKQQGEPERIGAVKLMLMAHSEVFRLELEDSELAEKTDVKVKDVHPGTFKGMLKYVYGHDTTSDMCFDDADNMLYVAEKYMMQTLKNKLAVRLMELLNPDNICSLLNNPACYKHLELDSAITEILRFETDRVLDSPEFVFMNAEGFLKILEQDGLVVPEIELWRAALKWAKHKANSEDGQQLRQQISCFTKHLRLCSLTGDEIYEVAKPEILTSNEIGIICQCIGRKEKPLNLTEISDEIVPRKRMNATIKPRVQRMLDSLKQKQYEMVLRHLKSDSRVDSKEYNFTLTTKQNAVELLPLLCSPKDYSWVDCTTTITKEPDPQSPDSSSTHEPVITAEYSDRMMFQVPLRVKGDNVILLPDTKYTFHMKLNVPHWCGEWDGATHTNDHLTLTLIDSNHFCHPASCSTELLSREVTRKQTP